VHAPAAVGQRLDLHVPAVVVHRPFGGLEQLVLGGGIDAMASIPPPRTVVADRRLQDEAGARSQDVGGRVGVDHRLGDDAGHAAGKRAYSSA
jgi:hypothetical protein